MTREIVHLQNLPENIDVEVEKIALADVELNYV